MDTDQLNDDLRACLAAYTHVCEAITPDSPPGDAEAMAMMVKILRKERDDAVSLKTKMQSYIDQSLEAICRRPGMYGSMSTVESLVMGLMTMEEVLRDSHPTENLNTWRKWLAEHYPDVPSRVRNLAYAIRWTYGEKDHREMFQKELTRMVQTLRKSS